MVKGQPHSVDTIQLSSELLGWLLFGRAMWTCKNTRPMRNRSGDRPVPSLQFSEKQITEVLVRELTERYDGSNDTFIGSIGARLVAAGVVWRLHDLALRDQV